MTFTFKVKALLKKLLLTDPLISNSPKSDFFMGLKMKVGIVKRINEGRFWKDADKGPNSSITGRSYKVTELTSSSYVFSMLENLG